MEEAKFFNYRVGNTFMHRLPGWIKILLMIVLAIASFKIPFPWVFIVWFIFVIFSVVVLKFSVREVRTDMFPMIAYFVLIELSSLILNIIEVSKTGNFCWTFKEIALLFVPEKDYLTLFFHLSLSIEVTSIFYRTTSTVQFEEGFRTIEHAITRKDETPAADAISLTITFIPRIAQFWNRIEKAWKSRGGKNNLRKIVVLVPVLFRISMNEAYQKSLARQNRM